MHGFCPPWEQGDGRVLYEIGCDPILHELRERSRQERRSLNAVAIDALRRGLGQEGGNDELRKALGSLVVKEATAVYSPADSKARARELSESARHLADALDWTRGDN